MSAIIFTYMSGPRDGETITVDVDDQNPAVTIGRSNDNNLALPDDPDVSRRHARLVRRDGAWWLEDLGSSNGTFAGEFSRAVRVTTPVRIIPGDIFRLGFTRLRLEDDASELLANAQAAHAAAKQ
jgi:pSer/pThr/pTyr-binding forkhead associated (FHA) protein